MWNKSKCNIRRYCEFGTSPCILSRIQKKPGNVRRVPNAASKFKDVSLNNALLTVPDLLTNLLEIILRFRKHLLGVLADIEGMFMQVAIRGEDQSALRLL